MTSVGYGDVTPTVGGGGWWLLSRPDPAMGHSAHRPACRFAVLARAQTMFGKGVCTLAMLFGLLYMAMPIAIVGEYPTTTASAGTVRAAADMLCPTLLSPRQAPTFTRRTRRCDPGVSGTTQLWVSGTGPWRPHTRRAAVLPAYAVLVRPQGATEPSHGTCYVQPCRNCRQGVRPCPSACRHARGRGLGAAATPAATRGAFTGALVSPCHFFYVGFRLGRHCIPASPGREQGGASSDWGATWVTA